MQINNQVTTNQTITHEKPLELKQGEIYKATIKERNSDNEAILHIRGRDVPVKFEGKTPTQDRITVQINGHENQQVQVKVISETQKAMTTSSPQTEVANTQQALRSLGIVNPSPELRQAAQMILDKGIPLTKESVIELQNFIEKDKGTIDQRLNTVQALANKRLEVTTNHLRAIHEALNGRPLNEVLTSIAKEIDPNYQVRSREPMEKSVNNLVREVREQVQREVNVQRSLEQVRNEVVNNPRLEREVARQVERAVEEARMLQQSGREVIARERLVQALQTAEHEVMRSELRQQGDTQVNNSRPVPERAVIEQVREVREQVQREANVQRTLEQVRTEIINNPKIDRELVNQLERALSNARVLQQTGRELAAKEAIVDALQSIEKTINNQGTINTLQEDQLKPSETLKLLQLTVQKEADLQKAITQLNNQLQKAPFQQPIIVEIEKSIVDAIRLQDEGRELAARQQLMQAFTKVEQPIAKLDQVQQLETQQYLMNDVFQTQQVTSKDFIVRTVTEKLAKAQGDFKNFQREITRNLDNIQRLTESFKSQAVHQVKPLLEATIQKLDNTILKSDMMLLTDMKTEKRLLQASGQLAEAKRLLTKGNYQEANKIVQEVRSLIEKLDFKPSETKVRHFITKEELNLTTRTSSQQLLQQFDEMTRRAAMQEPSARQAFELVRGLGLNRESEIAQTLASGRQSDGEPHQNMKQALLQLMKMEEEQGRVSQQTSQALANITGQQLLSKSDNNNLQSMFFNLPFLLQDEVTNLQVFVNSRSEGQQVDWENCNLYFLIETKKLGEVGILVTATDRNLSLTIKNDQPLFKERMKPLVETCKDKLKEVGYNIANINFTTLNRASTTSQQSKQQEEQTKPRPTFTEKGFDFKI